MLFDTPVYFIFLTLVVVIYWRLRTPAQNNLVLFASYIFYGWWDWRFLGLMIASTVVDYWCAHWISGTQNKNSRKLALTISLSINLGFLGFFKYFNFFIDSFSGLLASLGLQVSDRTLQVLLPPGISFYTFQAIAYIVDVYAGRLAPAKSLRDYALFISLFPHCIAGPIQRPSHLLPQVTSPRHFDITKVWAGLMLIAFGLFQKNVIADNCSLLADAVFGGRLGPSTLASLAIGTYAFAWQIYGDFAGYSNIARGSAQLLGFHFMVNFRQPYLAVSLRDFWRRWHISLSTWLRDYLYIPLGGSRNGELHAHRNLLLTMVIGGLWHGANWTFVVWGALHGVGQSIGRFIRKLRGINEVSDESESRGLLSTWLKRIAIFHVVCLGWIFFRATSLGHATELIRGVTHLSWNSDYSIAAAFLTMFALPMFLLDLLNERVGGEHVGEKLKLEWQVAILMLLLLVTAFFAGSNANAFIYFQF